MQPIGSAVLPACGRDGFLRLSRPMRMCADVDVPSSGIGILHVLSKELDVLVAISVAAIKARSIFWIVFTTSAISKLGIR